MLDQATRLREIADRYCGPPPAAGPHIISIVSGKGGAGKSTVALNLGEMFAARGVNTLLLDADENIGNLDVLTGVAPKYRLGSIFSGEQDIDNVIVPLKRNLALLPADSGNTDYHPMTIEQQRELLGMLSELEPRFDVVVVDTAAGIGNTVIGFAVRSHEALVVTTPEPTSVMDAYALVKLITAADRMVPVKLVVNGARTSEEAEETARKLQLAVRHFLQRHVHYLGFIPHDLHVVKAVARQNPVVQEFPFSSAARSFSALAETLLDQVEHARGRRFETV